MVCIIHKWRLTRIEDCISKGVKMRLREKVGGDYKTQTMLFVLREASILAVHRTFSQFLVAMASVKTAWHGASVVNNVVICERSSRCNPSRWLTAVNRSHTISRINPSKTRRWRQSRWRHCSRSVGCVSSTQFISLELAVVAVVERRHCSGCQRWEAGVERGAATLIATTAEDARLDRVRSLLTRTRNVKHSNGTDQDSPLMLIPNNHMYNVYVCFADCLTCLSLLEYCLGWK